MNKDFMDIPAFPIQPLYGESWNKYSECDGITLRDYFAAKAMAAIISNWGHSRILTYTTLAEDAYSVADMMMEARKNNGK